MAAGIEVRVDKEQLLRLTQELEKLPRGLDTVLYRALNKVGVAARTDVVRRIAADLNVRQSELKKRNVSLTRAARKRLFVLLRISGARIPLIRFRSRQMMQGVKAKVRKAGSAKLYPGAFQESPGPRRGAGKSGRPTTMPDSSHKGVFKRTGRWKIATKGHYVGKRREVITELRGPSVPLVMLRVRELARAALEARLGDKLLAEVDSQARMLLEKQGVGNRA